MHTPLPNLEDFQLAQLCIDRNPQALAVLQRQYRPQIIAYLMKSGANQEEAEEIVEQLWADTVMAPPGETPRLARYDGSCKLSTWLNTVALNRHLSAKRKQKRLERFQFINIHEEAETAGGGGGFDELIDLPTSDDIDQPLVELLRGAIESAFAHCSAENFVLLQLAHGDGLRVVELAQIWGCNPGTVSRRLEQAGSEIERLALAYVKKTDPYLDVTWSDFLLLCRSTSLGALGFS